MKYNFDQENNRRGTDSYRWHIKDNEYSFDVADMDFKVSDEIIEGFKSRIDEGIFGYAYFIDEWFDAYISWYKDEHNLEINKDWMFFSTGVVATISSTVRALTEVGDKVCVMQPVYNIFFNSVLNNKRILISSDLVRNGDKYEINYKDLEEKLSDPKCKLLIFCNPHNPVGRVWTKEEIERVGEIAKRTNTYVISDEIHCDLTNPDVSYVPFISVNETCKNIAVMAISPTKTFNLAGIQTSAVFIPNPEIKKKVERQLNTDECAEGNVLAIRAPYLAFKKSKVWYKEMREYIYQNKLFVDKYLKENIPDLHLIPSEGLYLIWVDISKITRICRDFCEKLKLETGIKVVPGSQYGPSGEGYIRINVATNRARIKFALDKIKEFINKK